jgi:orotidine-5'-phosphate decarboxylase
MVRYGDQEHSSPGGSQYPQVTPQTPVARTPREHATREGASKPDGQQGGEARPAEQDDAHALPRQAPRRRASLLRRPESLRAMPSLARFLTRASLEPADARTGRDPVGDEPAVPVPAGPEPADLDLADRTQEGGREQADNTEAGQDQAEWETEPRGNVAGQDTGRRFGAVPPVDVPRSSAAELRELAELSDLLAELAGLVHDLGALIVGLMTAATSAGDLQVRTFTIPPELAELAAAHQELKAEQQALNARFEASDSQQERAALRASLAALTERATRAVSAAVAAVAPEDDHSPGRSSEGATRPRGSGAQLREPKREETDVQSTTGGTSPRGPVQWRDTVAADRRLAPVAVALDAPDIDVAAHWATLVTPHVSTVKIGLELYLRYGPAVVATVRGGSGVHVFLDLKLHDIPNTVAGAARAVSKLRPEILTVHAAGGADMIKAAVEAAPDAVVAGVTLLTSIGDKDLAELGMEGSVSDAVRRMATLAVSAGARGLVCSPQEVAAVRAEVGEDILLITPGIRLAGATSDDQARIATPVEALKAGADLLVIGRPITKASDPGAAAAAIAGSLRRAVLARGGTPPCFVTAGDALAPPRAWRASTPHGGLRPRMEGSPRLRGLRPHGPMPLT